MDVPLPQLKDNFTKHLSIPGNNRILFSGAFGSGKTYFLKHYFKENPEHIAIHLFPVNYSVASNEDVFEFIKYDILFKILEIGVDFDKIEIPFSITFQNFATQNIHNAFSPFLNAIPKVGQGLKKIYDDLYQLAQKYYDAHKSVQVDEERDAFNYLKTFANQKGKLTENDFYTELIIKCIDRLKKGNVEEGTKKCVLIIDDLDRIDPEHLFRIFNNLAAHVDYEDDTNKFHFDNIILVCDVFNVKNIFYNRYGSNVDFSGYAQKFYSNDVFVFNPSKEIGLKFQELVELIVESEKIEDLYEFPFILRNFTLSNQLNLRSISKLLDKKYQFTSAYYWAKTYYRRGLKSVPFFKLFDILKWIFEDIEKILSACQNTRMPIFDHDDTSLNKLYLENLLPILAYDQHLMDLGIKQSFQLDIASYRILYTAEISPSSNAEDEGKIFIPNFSIEKVSLINNLESKLHIDEVDYFRLLFFTIKKGQELKLLT